jgi:hypothetical protein
MKIFAHLRMKRSDDVTLLYILKKKIFKFKMKNINTIPF